jgi:glucuronate isomerase
VIDVEHEAFTAAMERFAELTGEDVHTWRGYLAAHAKRRANFRAAGATATDHGFATAQTANLSASEAAALFDRIVSGSWSAKDAELFRAQMLTEMAKMSVEDGMTMQIHAGSFRNHNTQLFHSHGRDKGADIPMRTDYVHALKPMLDVVGNKRDLTIILFTLDESAYARELAPLAGHYPCLRLGPSWWFHDSPEGMRRFREMTTETAGFYNTVGFNDDTRAFLSIPARHDVARRVDCAFLARLVSEGRLEDWEAAELARDLTYTLVKQAYRIE